MALTRAPLPKAELAPLAAVPLLAPRENHLDRVDSRDCRHQRLQHREEVHGPDPPQLVAEARRRPKGLEFGLSADRQGDPRASRRAEDRPGTAAAAISPTAYGQLRNPAAAATKSPTLVGDPLPRERREEGEHRLVGGPGRGVFRPCGGDLGLLRGVSRREDLGGARPILRFESLCRASGFLFLQEATWTDPDLGPV